MLMMVNGRKFFGLDKTGKKSGPSFETFSSRKHRDNGKLCFHNGSKILKERGRE